MFKKFIAGFLAISLLMSTTVFANPLPTNLAGTNTLVAPVFAVLLPTAPAVAINPLQIGGGPQLSSPWFVIANRSNVPVMIEMRVGPNHPATNPSTFVGTAAEINPAGTARQLFMELQWGQLAAAPGTNFGHASTAVQLVAHPWAEPIQNPGPGQLYPARQVVPNAAITGNPRTATAGSTLAGGIHNVVFLDGHATNATAPFAANTTAAMTTSQVVAFRFGGALNPSATWAAGQAAVRVIFDIRGVNGGVGHVYRNAIRANNAAARIGGAGYEINNVFAGETFDVSLTTP